MPRATSPWRRLTPFAARLARRANWLMPNGSPASSGRVRPSRMIASGSTRVVVREAAQRFDDLLGGIGVVARRDGRVGGEDGPGPHGLQAGVERAAVRARLLERHERGVALVEVQDAGLDAERGERAGAADAEQDVLGEPRVGLADVQARRDPARGEVVLGALGVEQVERHAPDVDPPDLRGHLHVAHGHRHRDRCAVGAGDERGGEPLGVGVDPVLVLPAAGIDPLAEVALAVHEADRGERERAVGRLLEDVARERAEPAGVHRERAVHAELRAEVRDRAARGSPGPRRRGARDPRGPRPPRPPPGRAARRRTRRARACRRRPRRGGGPGSHRSAPSARGRRTRTARGRPASRTSGSCRRGAPGRRGAGARGPPAPRRRAGDRRCRQSSTGHDGTDAVGGVVRFGSDPAHLEAWTAPGPSRSPSRAAPPGSAWQWRR